MSYQFPNYIIQADIAKYPIDYKWDDTEVEDILDEQYAEQFTSKLESITLRSRFILMAGIYEWALARLGHYSQNRELFEHIAQVAYCATINPCYLIGDIEIEREDFLGPIEGALWCTGYAGLISNYHVAYNAYLENDDNYTFETYDPTHAVNECILLISLTTHILPQDKIILFKIWLERNIDYFEQNNKLTTFDPLKYLFTVPEEKIWFGDYIAKEALDPDYPYNPKDAVKLCDQFLQQVDYHNNPLLVPPEQLTGKIKHPYRLLE